MRSSPIGTLRSALCLLLLLATPVVAQRGHPHTRADSLLGAGEWATAEAAFYQQSQRAPRDPVMRAALGRYLAMKGAVRPGMVLIEEAQRFGLSRRVATEMLEPLRSILDWRRMATTFSGDSTIASRRGRGTGALFQIAMPRADDRGIPVRDADGTTETRWHDVVTRQIGVDSVSEDNRPIGIEVFEALSPSMTVRTGVVVLHGNPRSALAATGRRLQVLRSAEGIRVLVSEGRVLELGAALRELKPTWWQLDLPHGILVVRVPGMTSAPADRP